MGMDTHEVARRILAQRMGRYIDHGPAAIPSVSARFRLEDGRVRVGYASAQPGDAARMISQVQRFAETRRLRVEWSVVPARPGEEELASALQAAHFDRIEDLLLMGHAGLITAPLNPLVIVRQISRWHDMWEYEYGSRVCFYDDARPSDALVQARAGERWREQEQGWCRYYQAYVNGALAGGCYVSLYEDVPTLMGVYALPHARRQGVATALLATAIAGVISPRNDITCLFVEHGNPAEALYRGLGFLPLYDAQLYLWSPGGMPTIQP